MLKNKIICRTIYNNIIIIAIFMCIYCSWISALMHNPCKHCPFSELFPCCLYWDPINLFLFLFFSYLFLPSSLPPSLSLYRKVWYISQKSLKLMILLPQLADSGMIGKSHKRFLLPSLCPKQPSCRFVSLMLWLFYVPHTS